jgi:Protein of unknown function (DUF1173)
MTTYRIGSILVHPEQGDFGVVLGEAYKANLKPFCMCNGEPGHPMYITHIGDGFFIKRNPNTGRAHAVGCGSWEMPDEFSGRGDLGSGVTYEEGKALLRLAFPLAKQGNRVAPPPKVGGNEDKLSVKNDSKRLSLQGLLHMLWDEAGLAKWHGGEPDRRWEFVQQSLLEAAGDKVVKQHALSHFMFVPEAWVRERAEEQESTRRKRFIEFAVQQSKKGHQLMLLIAEVKKIEPSSSGGYRIVFKHVPGFSFALNDELKGRIDKHYSREMIVQKATEEKYSHLMVAATFSVQAEGTAEIEEICYMPVNSQWLPFDNIYEHDLIGKLIATKRSFLRPLRYNRLKTAVMPTVVLTDTGSGPTALYVIPPDQDSERVQNASLEVDYNKWFWDTKEHADKMPDLPPKMETTEDERDYLQRVGQLPRGVAAPPVARIAPVFTPEPPPAHPFLKTSAPASGSQPQAASDAQGNHPASTPPAASLTNGIPTEASAGQASAPAPVAAVVPQASGVQATQPQAQAAETVKTPAVPVQPVTIPSQSLSPTLTRTAAGAQSNRPMPNPPSASPMNRVSSAPSQPVPQAPTTATAKAPVVPARPGASANQLPPPPTSTPAATAPATGSQSRATSGAQNTRPTSTLPSASQTNAASSSVSASRPPAPAAAPAKAPTAPIQPVIAANRATNPTPTPVRSVAPQAPVASQARPVSPVAQGGISQPTRPAGPVASADPTRLVPASTVATRPAAPLTNGSPFTPVARPATSVASVGPVRPAMLQGQTPTPVSPNPSAGSQQSAGVVRPEAAQTAKKEELR